MIPLYLWGEMTEPGEAAWDVGRRRAAREEGSFSYRNATIIEHDGHCAGCLIGYEIPDNPDPIPDDMPSMFVPLQELENQAPGTWYINVLAVRPQFRSQGLGTKLLALAEDGLGKRGMSVIVSDANLGAHRGRPVLRPRGRISPSHTIQPACSRRRRSSWPAILSIGFQI
jgi:ribosomal protein S18 acetylase RimI-like enzyme